MRVRDPEQYMEALALANEARRVKAVLKQDIAAGRVCVYDLVSDTDSEAAGMPVFELLKAQPRWGKQRALRALRSAGIPEGKRLRELTVRQRGTLLRYF